MNQDDVCFYSVKDFSKMLSISEQGIRKLLREGQIKSIRLNTAKRSKHRIPKSELLRLQSSAYGLQNE